MCGIQVHYLMFLFIYFYLLKQELVYPRLSLNSRCNQGWPWASDPHASPSSSGITGMYHPTQFGFAGNQTQGAMHARQCCNIISTWWVLNKCSYFISYFLLLNLYKICRRMSLCFLFLRYNFYWAWASFSCKIMGKTLVKSVWCLNNGHMKSIWAGEMVLG